MFLWRLAGTCLCPEGGRLCSMPFTIKKRNLFKTTLVSWIQIWQGLKSECKLSPTLIPGP